LRAIQDSASLRAIPASIFHYHNRRNCRECDTIHDFSPPFAAFVTPATNVSISNA
jgi:hypothetical protein